MDLLQQHSLNGGGGGGAGGGGGVGEAKLQLESRASIGTEALSQKTAPCGGGQRCLHRALPPFALEAHIY